MKIQFNLSNFIFFLFLASCSPPDNETIPSPIQSSITEFTLSVNSGEGGTSPHLEEPMKRVLALR